MPSRHRIAVTAAPGAVFGNAGQDCCARSRILVECSAMDDFLDLLSAGVSSMRVGDPMDEATEMGPLITAEHRSKVASFLDDDTTVVARGTAPEGPGFSSYRPHTLDPLSIQVSTVISEWKTQHAMNGTGPENSRTGRLARRLKVG